MRQSCGSDNGQTWPAAVTRLWFCLWQTLHHPRETNSVVLEMKAASSPKCRQKIVTLRYVITNKIIICTVHRCYTVYFDRYCTFLVTAKNYLQLHNSPRICTIEAVVLFRENWGARQGEWWHGERDERMPQTRISLWKNLLEWRW